MTIPEHAQNRKPAPTDALHGAQDLVFQSALASTHLRVIAPEGGVVFVGPLSRARPFELPGDLKGALAHASSVVLAGDDCYVTPGLFERTHDRTVKRDLQHALGAWVAWCDADGWDDDRESTYLRLREDLGVDAVFRVQTSPGRYHVYLRLMEMISPENVKVVNERLVVAFDGDPAPMHAAAWMRLAGTVHQPKPKDADDPVRNMATPIVFVEGPGDGVVTVEDFHRALDRLRATPSGREANAREALRGAREGVRVVVDDKVLAGRDEAFTHFLGYAARRLREDRDAYEREADSANLLMAEPLRDRQRDKCKRSVWTRELAKESTANDGRPVVIINRRDQRSIVTDLVRGVRKKNDALLYEHAGRAVILSQRDHKAPHVERITPDMMRVLIDAAVVTKRCGVDGLYDSSVTTAQVASTLVRLKDDEQLRVPQLTMIIESPIMLADGGVLDTPGYDETTGVLFVPSAGYLPVPEHPTGQDAKEAAQFLMNDLFGDFPFADDAHRANALAFLLTPFVRLATPCVPVAIVDSPTPGTGKDLLVRIVSIVAYGRAPSAIGPMDETERRKHVGAKLLAGATFIAFSNYNGELRSKSLEMDLTAPTIDLRELGFSRAVAVDNLVTWSLTGNNVSVAGDLSRRTYHIRLDAKIARPHLRGDWRHEHLETWALEHRAELVRAVLTILKAWHVAGRPAAPGDRPAFGSFEIWDQTIAGALHHAGIDGFLDDRIEWLDQLEDDTLDDGLFVKALHDHFTDRAFTTRELHDAFEREGGMGFLTLAATPEVQEAFDAKSPVKALGHALKALKDRRFGDGLPYLIQRIDPHQKLSTWIVRNDDGV